MTQLDQATPSPDIDSSIRSIARDQEPAAAALALALVVHRATNELQRLTRYTAGQRRGQPDWGAWASLQNASRDMVLKAATCRKTARQLAASVDDDTA
ncbi:MAG: hypothetical protein CL878_02125 [Dehalococcoidia bacterium]|nr:hypothetical protein [Dehalococcoidia bacterium]